MKSIKPKERKKSRVYRPLPREQNKRLGRSRERARIICYTHHALALFRFLMRRRRTSRRRHAPRPPPWIIGSLLISANEPRACYISVYTQPKRSFSPSRSRVMCVHLARSCDATARPKTRPLVVNAQAFFTGSFARARMLQSRPKCSRAHFKCLCLFFRAFRGWDLWRGKCSVRGLLENDFIPIIVHI